MKRIVSIEDRYPTIRNSSMSKSRLEPKDCCSIFCVFFYSVAATSGDLLICRLRDDVTVPTVQIRIYGGSKNRINDDSNSWQVKRIRTSRIMQMYVCI